MNQTSGLPSLQTSIPGRAAKAGTQGKDRACRTEGSLRDARSSFPLVTAAFNIQVAVSIQLGLWFVAFPEEHPHPSQGNDSTSELMVTPGNSHHRVLLTGGPSTSCPLERRNSEAHAYQSHVVQECRSPIRKRACPKGGREALENR